MFVRKKRRDRLEWASKGLRGSMSRGRVRDETVDLGGGEDSSHRPRRTGHLRNDLPRHTADRVDSARHPARTRTRCLREFLRGDVNGSDLREGVDISDIVFLINELLRGGAVPPCLDAAGANDDGVTDISDVLQIIDFLFSDRLLALPPPCPTKGVDPLGCETTQE